MENNTQSAIVPSSPTENVYRTVRGFIIAAQKQLYAAVNTAMVEAYWNI